MLSHPRVLVVQQEDADPPGLFGHWLAEAGVCVDVVRAYEDPIPPLSDGRTTYSGLLVMGGGFDADDEERHPWLPVVRERIVEAAEAGIPTLGICLGLQLAALALGGTVERNPYGPTIGVRQVDWEPEVLFDPLLHLLAGDDRAMHWNEYVVADLPEGAVRLASSLDGQVQAARFAPTVWGVSFHPEADVDTVERWTRDGAETLDRIGVRAEDLLDQVTEARPALVKAWQPLAFAFARLVRGRTAASDEGGAPRPGAS